MAIIRTEMALGITTPPRPQTAGAVHHARHIVDPALLGAIGTGDVVAIGPQQPYSRILDAYLMAEGDWTGITVTAGFLDEGAGTVGTQFFDAQAVTGTAIVRLSKSETLIPGHIETERPFGMRFSANVAVVAGRRITLALFYRQ